MMKTKRLSRYGFCFIVMLISGIVSCSLSANSGEGVWHNGVHLEHKGQTVIKGTANAQKLVFEEGSTDFDLNSSGDNSYDLTIIYWEYKPGDASFALSEGRIEKKTQSGKPCLISSVRGQIPKCPRIEVDLGSGDFRLSDYPSCELLLLEFGSGDVTLNNLSDVGHIEIEVGSGDITFANLRSIPVINTESGSGDLNATSLSKVGLLNVSSGSGDIMISDSQVDDVRYNTGSGDITLRKSVVGNLDGSTGSGDVNLVETTVNSAVKTER